MIENNSLINMDQKMLSLSLNQGPIEPHRESNVWIICMYLATNHYHYFNFSTTKDI